MLPRSIYSPALHVSKQSALLDYADLEMTKAFVNIMMKVLRDNRAQHPVLKNLSEQQYAAFNDNLILHNEAFYSHSLFVNVYKEPNGLELVKSFLKLLQQLPNELRILAINPADYFSNRLRNIVNFTNTVRAIYRLTIHDIHALMLNNSNYKALSNKHQQLFDGILFYIKTKLKTDLAYLAETRTGYNTSLLVKPETFPQRFGMSVIEAQAVALDLDKALQKEFMMLMSNYLSAFVRYHNQLPPSGQNAAVFKIILLEVKNHKSPLAFYNMQLGYIIDRPLLMNVLKNTFQRQIDANLNIDTWQRPFYFITLLAKFDPDFPTARLTKSNALEGVNKILPLIIGSKCLMEEKLIQFQVLFALTEYYANSHTSPTTDHLLGIENTRTWQQLMSTIRAAAFWELKNEKNYLHPRDASHDLSVLKAALVLPLFNQHRGNYSGFFGGKTSTVDKIKVLIEEVRHPRENRSYR